MCIIYYIKHTKFYIIFLYIYNFILHIYIIVFMYNMTLYYIYNTGMKDV